MGYSSLYVIITYILAHSPTAAVVTYEKSSHISYFMQLRKHKSLAFDTFHCIRNRDLHTLNFAQRIGNYKNWIFFTNLLLFKRCCISNVSNYSMQNILWLGWLVSHVLTKKGFFLFLIIAAMQLFPMMQFETYMSVSISQSLWNVI